MRRARSPLKAKLIAGYVATLGVGGLATAYVVSVMVGSTIAQQARTRIIHDRAVILGIFDRHQAAVRDAVVAATCATTIQQLVTRNDPLAAGDLLGRICRNARLDFLTLTDANGRVVARARQDVRTGDDLSKDAAISTALAGSLFAAVEILDAAFLEREGLTRPQPEPVGLALLAAAPVPAGAATAAGALYGGSLIDGAQDLVAQLWGQVYGGELYGEQELGVVGICAGPQCIALNSGAQGDRQAWSALLAPEMDRADLRGDGSEHFRGRVGDTWYLICYAPLRDQAGTMIGSLFVGTLEKANRQIHRRIISTFLAITVVGVVLVTLITYYRVDRITRPLSEMVDATRRIGAGELDLEVRSTATDEIGLLAESFNAMLRNLRQMKHDLEEWGHTLERKVTERTEEMLAMQIAVTQSEKLAAIGMLAAGVAHEINNPLGGIHALTALVMEDMPPDDANRENLAEVIRQTERCREIVMSLLEFSRQSQPRTERIDVNAILSDTLALIEKQAVFLNITVIRRMAPNLPAVNGDRSQLQQVFINVLMNAVQAMDERGRLTVLTRHHTVANAIETVVSDTGCGIPAESLNRIFDPFYTTKASGKGTGLGLATAYGIIAKHGGTISVSSAVGVGSTFTICIPVAPEADAGGDA